MSEALLMLCINCDTERYAGVPILERLAEAWMRHGKWSAIIHCASCGYSTFHVEIASDVVAVEGYSSFERRPQVLMSLLK